ncbi:probable E3 ubiquitin-protein ligase RHG1A isoform X1 [Prosopis cineraria]|uniref:probable E3 ubiquitin-protein ligase RHG1A isoform X1 n=1 Tax=Prosopis cineraria TaxID=364024 RepID=UPI00240FAC8A|nr:probable E3 ubiquitin-protein ligase RHG1A isoform X1 [Prosopis cineraria]XP_054818561.1 probable E3 ubiquitin-protein ligase RHG1A isoform X1 [Prosopis cineraria]
MQGTRGRIGSLAETLEFDCGSTSSNATVDQQICWDGTRNPLENQSPQIMLSPGDVNPLYANSINHEWKSVNNWRIGEPGSSDSHIEINNDEQKRELGWSSSTSAGAGSRLGWQFESTNLPSLDNVNTSPTCMNNSNPHSVSQNLNLNASLADAGFNMGQHLEHPSLNKPSGSVNEPIPPTVGPAPFAHPSGSNMVDNSSGRLGYSTDAQRVSCKRKAVEGYVGQSSEGESSSRSQYTENCAWHTLPTQSNSWSSLSRSATSALISSRPGRDVGDESSESIDNLNVARSSNSFLRNSRLRINPSNQQDSIPFVAFSNDSVTRRSTIPSCSPMTQSFCPVDGSMDLRSAPSADIVPQSQPFGTSSPLRRNMPSFRWSGSSNSRNSHLSNSMIWPDRDTQLYEEGSSRSMSRSINDPMFVPVADLRNSVRSPTNRALSSANLNISGNVTSSPHTGLSSAFNLPSIPSWVSRPNPLHHPRRLSDYVHRSLLSSVSEAAGGFSNSNSFLRSAPITLSEARAPSSRAGSQGRHQSHSISPWVERRGDSNFRLPYSLQTLAVASEGSGRLGSELRSVLGLMCRGRNIRFEDFMIFDHSVFSGMADIHDRHRDMRLDVDNMSYEELLALEERIGNVSTGLSEETVLKLMKRRKYSVEEGSQCEAEPCCICQEEFDNGDDVGTLDCGHDYHTNCIKQWLMQKNLCPICKTTGLAT